MKKLLGADEFPRNTSNDMRQEFLGGDIVVSLI